MHFSLTFMTSTAALFTLAFTSPIASSSTPHVHVVRNEAATNAHKAITNAVATTNVEKLAAVNAIQPDKRSYASINAEDISTERASLNAIRPTNNKRSNAALNARPVGTIHPFKRSEAAINAGHASKREVAAINTGELSAEKITKTGATNAGKATNANRVAAINAGHANKRWEEAAINAGELSAERIVKTGVTNASKATNANRVAINAVQPDKREVEGSA